MINGHLIEQIAHRVNNIDKAVERYAAQGIATWIRDTVEAVHIYADNDYRLGESFKVNLAFNYDMLDGGAKMEYELIELMSGVTVQLQEASGTPAVLSHWGYDVANQGDHNEPDALSQELSAYIQKGFRVTQVSQTVLHANTKRRYRYAFVDTRQLHGTWLKVIQRMSMPSDARTVTIGRDQFRWLEDPARSLTDRLITAAGYPNWTEEGPPFGGPFADEFSEIIVALRYIGNRKVDDYGNSRLEIDKTIPDYDLKMLYSDLHRKHIRINEQMASIKERTWSDELGSVDSLMETLGDLAVYSIRGIQILARLEEAWHEKARTGHRSE